MGEKNTICLRFEHILLFLLIDCLLEIANNFKTVRFGEEFVKYDMLPYDWSLIVI